MRALRTWLPTLICPLLLLLGSAPEARANIYTDLASAFDTGDPYDFNVKVGYKRTLKKAAIKREIANRPGEIWTAKDLRYSQIRHLLNIRVDLALWRDLQLHVEFPIVLSDRRYLDFARNGGDPCGVDDCVDKTNSTITQGGFLPKWQEMGKDQIAVAGPDPVKGGLTLPDRAGLDQFHVGLSWAPINQRRDPTKPTWVIGFEARIAVGDPMQYNPFFDAKQKEVPTNVKTNDSVGRGVHQFHWWMTVSKRYKYVDPYVTFFYLLPVEATDSQFEWTSFEASGQERHQPQHRGGGEVGLEIIPWEKPAKKMKFTIELGARVEGVFEGRGYSELWEVFANNPVLQGPCRPSGKSYNPRFWDNGVYCIDNENKPGQSIPFLGITSIENHAIFTATLGFNLEMTEWFRARLGLSLGHEQQHFITFGDSGRNTPNSDQPFIEYEREEEVNPMYRPYIDMSGRRYRVGETTVFDFTVDLQARF